MDQAARGMLDVARSVLAELDLEVVLERVLESARELTGARYAALGVLDATGSDLDRFLTLGIDEATRRGDRRASARPRRPWRADPQPGALATREGRPAPPLVRLPGCAPADGHVSRRSDPRRGPALREPLPHREGGRGRVHRRPTRTPCVLLAEFAGVAIDHAGRYTGAKERRDELERTVAALDATTQIARALGGETDLEVVLELVAKRGRALVSARTLLIELEQGESLFVAAGAGELPDGVLGERVALRETVASAALRTRRTQNLDDELNRSRFEQYGVGRLGVAAESGLIVPLVFQAQDVRGARGARPARGRARVLGRRPAPARGVRGERCHRRRHRAVHRRGAAQPAPHGRRGRAPALGARARTTRRSRAWPRSRCSSPPARRSDKPGDARRGRRRRDRAPPRRRSRTSAP